MSDRTVEVKLDMLIDTYQRHAAMAVASTRAVAGEIRVLGSAAVENERNLKRVGLAAGIAGAAMVAAEVKAGSVWASFSKQISGVAAVSDASASQMGHLSDAAIAAGANTKLAGVSASDAARAEAELAKAGVSVNDILGGALIGSLQLASAGQIDFADAATISAQAMHLFNLSGSQVGHVADVLAAGANKSATDVAQLGLALRQGGLVASQVGLGLEDTVGTLSLFADHALIGSDAGTSFKAMLQRLAPQSQQAQKEMARLGFTAFDTQGNFVGLTELAARMQASFGKLSTQQRLTALNMIFGQDAVRSASVLIDAGATGVDRYVKAVDDQGAAARMAAIQMNNLAGDVENLGGTMEAAIIKTGQQADGGLRGTVQAITSVVSGYASLPPVAQQATLGIVGATTAGLGFVGVAGSMIPRIRQFTDFLESAGGAGQLLARNLTNIGFAAGGAVAGLLLVTEAIGNSEQQAGELVDKLTTHIDRSSLDDVTKALDDIRGRLGQSTAQWDTYGNTVEKAAFSLLEMADPFSDNEIDNTFADMQHLSKAEQDLALLQNHLATNTGYLADVYGLTTKQVAELAKRTGIDLSGVISTIGPLFRDAYAGVSAASPITQRLTEDTTTLADTVTSAKDQLSAFSDALDAVYAQQFAVSDATGQVTTKLGELISNVDDARKGGDMLAASLENNTMRGVENQQALSGLVQGALDVAKAMLQQGDSATTVALRMADFRDNLAQALVQAGFARDKVDELTAALLQIPTDDGITITVHTEQAIAVLNDFIRRLSSIPSFIQSNVSAAEEHDAVRFRNQLTLGPPSIDSTINSAIPAAQDIARHHAAAAHGSSGSDAAAQAEQERLRQVKEWNDAMERNAEEHLKRMQQIEDNEFQHGRMSNEQYRAILMQRFEDARKAHGYWSDEAQTIYDQIKTLDDDAVTHWMETLRRQHEVGDLSTADFLKALRDRLAGLKLYSDEYMQLWREINQIEADAAAQSRQSNETLRRTQVDSLSNLNQLLDDEAAIRKRMEQSSVQHHQRLLEIQQRYVDGQRQILDQRKADLVDWASIEERFTAGWANSVSSLAGNTRQQSAAFEEWQRLLAEAKERGVSDAVVQMLGLDDGPKALAQLRMFSTATQLQIDDLNSAVAQRVGLAGDEVSREQADTTSKVGQMLVDLVNQQASQIEAETEQFLADQRAMSDELAAVGMTQGRSFGDAVAAGLLSSIPAIVAAAQAAQAAMAAANASASAAKQQVIQNSAGRATNPRLKDIAPGGKVPVFTLSGLTTPTVNVGGTSLQVFLDGKKAASDAVKVVLADHAGTRTIVGSTG